MRKRRTRSHIIADLSVNYVEKQVLLCGHTVERMIKDYGIDLLLSTYNEDGEIENETIKLQLKATDNLNVLQDGQTIAFSVERADLEFWLNEFMPFIFVVYDAQADAAYWVYLQAYFQSLSDFDLRIVGETVTIHMNKANIVNADAVRQFVQFKVDVLRQLPKEIHYVL